MGEGTGSSEKRKKKAPRNRSLLTNTDGMISAKSDKKMKKVARNKKSKGIELPAAETFVSSRPNDVNEGRNSAETSGKKRNKLKKKKIYEKLLAADWEDVLQSDEDGDYSNHEVEEKARLCGGYIANHQSADSRMLQKLRANSDKKMKKDARKKKRKGTELPETEAKAPEIVSPTPDDVDEGKNSIETSKKRKKLKKKKKDKENRKKGSTTNEQVQHSNEAGEDSNEQIGKSKSVSQIKNDAAILDDDDDEVYQISSGDEDETTGMKRWITKYHRARPGAEVLMENINDFLVDYWAQKEKERKEKEEEAAEGGWTVVTHFKGRKKTTDAESGTTVGSVAQAAVKDKMSKKKDKQVGLNFYRFQKREAQRSEIMMLQSKFEQDKKRIQQLRAARKFRPY